MGHTRAKTERLCNIARTAGLEINVKKTHNTRINASPLTVHGEAIEEVDRFTYLGSIVSKTGRADEGVKAKISTKPVKLLPP